MKARNLGYCCPNMVPTRLNQDALALESFLSIQRTQPLTSYSELVGRGGAKACANFGPGWEERGGQA